MSAVNWNALWETVRQKTKARGISTIRDLDVDEISLVADPANLFSKVIITKRHEPEGDDVDLNHQPVVPDKEKAMPAMDPAGGGEEVEMLKGIIEEQQEIIEELAKAVEEIVDPAELEKMAMEDEDTGEEPPYPGPAEEDEEMDKSEVGHDPTNAEHEFPEDEIEGEDLQKALNKLPPVISNLLAEMSDRIMQQDEEARITKSMLMQREDQIRQQELSDAATELAGLPMTHDDTTQFLGVLDQNLPPDQFDMVHNKLLNMSNIMQQQPIMKEYGSSMVNDRPGSDVLNYATEVANQVIQKSGGDVDEAVARAKVWEAEPSLYNEYILQTRNQGR